MRHTRGMGERQCRRLMARRPCRVLRLSSRPLKPLLRPIHCPGPSGVHLLTATTLPYNTTVLQHTITLLLLIIKVLPRTSIRQRMSIPSQLQRAQLLLAIPQALNSPLRKLNMRRCKATAMALTTNPKPHGREHPVPHQG